MNPFRKKATKEYPYYNRKKYKINNWFSVEKRDFLDWFFWLSIGYDEKDNKYFFINVFNFRFEFKLFV